LALNPNPGNHEVQNLEFPINNNFGFGELSASIVTFQQGRDWGFWTEWLEFLS